jgi:hypothetical protein
LDKRTKKALFASSIATMLSIPLTYITLYTIMLLTGVTLSFTFGLIAYGIMNTVSIYTICTADEQSYTSSGWSWGFGNHRYGTDIASETGSIILIALLAIIAVILIGTLNGHIALGLVSWWQPTLPLIINAQAPILVSTLQLNDDQPTCKACLNTIEKTHSAHKTFYLPNSSKRETQDMATHSLLCEDCYHEYPNKEKDLVNAPSHGWHAYTLANHSA